MAIRERVGGNHGMGGLIARGELRRHLGRHRLTWPLQLACGALFGSNPENIRSYS
jgi:hypothetical protein